MKIFHQEGRLPILITTLLLLIQLSLFHFESLPLFIVLTLFLATTEVLVLRFFRIPHRFSHKVENGIISPADGLVIAIEKEFEHEYFKEDRIKISIFMSLFNVHVNFYPIDGEVKYVGYHPGKYFAAQLPKASNDNEHNSIVVQKEDGRAVMFRQIAGLIARRIVSYPKVGDKVEQGSEMGMIKFGSRLDVFVPLDANITIGIGDTVRTQKTVLAYFS